MPTWSVSIVTYITASWTLQDHRRDQYLGLSLPLIATPFPPPPAPPPPPPLLPSQGTVGGGGHCYHISIKTDIIK